MALVGHVWVSTEEQATARQLDALRAAGCREIFEERAAGGDRKRRRAPTGHRLTLSEVAISRPSSPRCGRSRQGRPPC